MTITAFLLMIVAGAIGTFLGSRLDDAWRILRDYLWAVTHSVG